MTVSFEWVSEILGQLQQSKTLLGIVLILIYGFATVMTMIGGEIRVILQERKIRKWEQQAEFEAQRIRSGWNEENSDEWTLTNETYHAAAPREQRKLNETWRDRVRQAAEPVMEETHVPQHNWNASDNQTTQWPTWTPQELATVGRHRYDETQVIDAVPVSPGQGYTPRQLRALVADTGQFSVIEAGELVGVGN